MGRLMYRISPVLKPLHAAGRPLTTRTALFLAVAVAPLALGACSRLSGASDVTGSIPPAAGQDAYDTALRNQEATLSRDYASSPRDKATAIRYATVLRKRGQFAQAVAVLQNVAIRNPTDRDVLGAYGKALGDAGRLEEAASVLARAHTPDNPNWSILSAQGSVADRMGDHQGARNYYQAALKIVPNEPTVLSNLGMSYTLTRELPKAEAALRQAAASPQADARVRQNLALVLSLEGRYAEAEQLAARDVSPEQASANVNAIRQMVAQSDSWKDLQQLDARAGAGKSAKAGTSVVARKDTPKRPQAPAATAAAGDAN